MKSTIRTVLARASQAAVQATVVRASRQVSLFIEHATLVGQRRVERGGCG